MTCNILNFRQNCELIATKALKHCITLHSLVSIHQDFQILASTAEFTVCLISYSFLLWAVQRTCGVQNCLLGIVEQLGDVLQVFR